MEGSCEKVGTWVSGIYRNNVKLPCSYGTWTYTFQQDSLSSKQDDVGGVLGNAAAITEAAEIKWIHDKFLAPKVGVGPALFV
ncbi:hypothetical protein NC653_028509 [Populus alba x Populus x berolinensis]|uniref:Uncharacterized protein n=1 Tax=Populus alba x Populus x berolinensis TaxID=444605 RepID=A0AAD6Q476_9ROSI|nr:hypothetical protein NC653_028509 [Populus alba x Populus x berolinensis]